MKSSISRGVFYQALSTEKSDVPTFGEALVFYTIKNDNSSKIVMIYKPLYEIEQPFKTVVRGRWPEAHENEASIVAMEAHLVRDIVGIWESNQSRYIYILRKHPALLSLPLAERGLVDEMEREDAFEDDRSESEHV
jgi:hypothetical protein